MEIHEIRFESLERVMQPDKFGWVGLDSLTDRRKSVGTEDGGGIGDDDTGRDADGDRLLGVETRGAGPRGLVWLRQDYDAGLIQDGAHESLESTGRRGGLIIYHGVMLKVELD